jgi:hypothetical protein
MHGDQLLFERNRANQIQEERFARAIFPDNDTEARAAVSDTFYIPHKRL